MPHDATGSARPSLVRGAICLFVSLSALYLLTLRGRVTSIDEWHVYGTAESLVDRGSWELRLPGTEPGESGARRPGDRRYSRYSVVPSLLAVPFCGLARPFADRFPLEAVQPREPADRPGSTAPGWTRREVLQVAATVPTALATAATALLVFLGLCRLSLSVSSALATALLFGVGTLALPYSGSLYVQPLAALGVAAVVLGTAARFHIAAAVALCFVVAVRMEFAVLVPWLVVDAWLSEAGRWRRIGQIVVSASAGIGIQLIVNVLRGDPLWVGDYGGEAFTTPFWVGLYGLVFSSGKGVAWFAPAAAVGLALVPWLCSIQPRIGCLIAATSGTIVILVACWWTWHGGWSWGPRLLVPIMPVAVLPWAWFFERWRDHRQGTRLVVLAVLIASVAVQFWAVAVDPVGDRGAVWPLIGGDENVSIYVPQAGPWGVETEQTLDFWWRRLIRIESGSRVAVWVTVAGLAVASAAGLLLALRSVAITASDLRRAFPALAPRQVVALAASLVLLAAPGTIERWLSAASGDSGGHGAGVPRQSRGLRRDDAGKRLTGRLCVPLRGTYTFQQQGAPGTQLYIDGRPVFRTPGELGGAAIHLDTGFHLLELRTAVSGQVNVLYWTTPGNARYREPVPRVYLTGPVVTWRDRAAIAMVHARWSVWVLVLLLWVWEWRRSAARPGPLPVVGMNQ